MHGAAILPGPAPAAVLACGAYLKNRACRIDGRQLHWSAPHGDLGDVQACTDLEASLEAMLAAPGVQGLAHDLHPDFHSSRLAHALAEQRGVPVVAVQHHHAHVAAVIAEQGLREPVIGIALDGFGLGNDGGAWGGELLWVDGGAAAHRWRRLAHLHPLALPGGDAAAREPWRLAAALLHALDRGDEIETRFGAQVGLQAARGVRAMLDRGLNCPPSSSAGRWFDAAAAALGLCLRQSGEAQAAMALECCAAEALRAQPDLATRSSWPSHGLDLRPVVAALLAIDPADTQGVARGAVMFHFALAEGLARAAISAAREHATNDIVFGGGCFANRVLGDRLRVALEAAGLRVHAPQAAGCGDAGLALGQAWVAACTLAGSH